MSLNVNRNVADIFYRYKMPKLIAKVEGKGNGIKTVIVNMSDVAKALGRPPTYPTKYFGCELGAQTYFDFKDDRFIVNGSHEVSKLQDLLDGFIKKFVLCQGCENPETTLCISTKKSTVHQSCKACGHYALIKGAHRLITFILKNPPDIAPAQQGSSLTEGKRSKRSKKQNGEENGDGSSPKPEDEDDDDDWYDSSPKEAIKDDDDDDWAVDVSEEAIRDRQNNLVDGIKILELADKTEKERTDMFFKYLQEKMRNGKKLDDKEILMEAERLDVRQKACLILAELFFNNEILKQIKTYRVILLRFCHNNAKAQKYLIGGIEQVINLNKETLLPKVPLIFKGLYDLDILEEEVLMEWHSKVSKKYVSKELSEQIHVKCDPFIKWLKEAEEEESSEEEDEEDDDVEIEYDDRARITSLSTQKDIDDAAASRKAILIENEDTGKNKKEEDDDLDIDAI